MLYITCNMISSVDLACYRVSRAKDWVSVDCGTSCDTSQLSTRKCFMKHYAPSVCLPLNKVRPIIYMSDTGMIPPSLKVSQFINILVFNCMPNIKILALGVHQIFCSQGCSCKKSYVRKWVITQPKIYEICSKVNWIIYI